MEVINLALRVLIFAAVCALGLKQCVDKKELERCAKVREGNAQILGYNGQIDQRLYMSFNKYDGCN